VIDKNLIKELLRFGVVGVVATAIHYAVYWLLFTRINETVAYSIGYSVSFLLNYYLSARFTFRRKTSVRNGLGFVGAHAFNYILQVTLLNIFIYSGISRSLAPVPVYCIAVPVNFMVVRFVFRRNR